jgi:hypothetical protein
MLASLARFLQHVNIFFIQLRFGMTRVVRINELRQPERAGHASRAASDDHYVGRHLRMINVRKRLAEADRHDWITRNEKFYCTTEPKHSPFLENDSNRANHHGESDKVIPLQRLVKIKDREKREHR